MKPYIQYVFYARFLLIFPCTTALAQDDFINSSGQQESTEIEGHAEKKYTIKFDAPSSARKYCRSSIAIDYLQKNTAAIVNMTLENLDCTASSGSYTVAVRVKDENNESQTIEFDETWLREDDRSLANRREYPIGNDIDLISVRIKRQKCVCAEIVDEANESKDPTAK